MKHKKQHSASNIPNARRWLTASVFTIVLAGTVSYLNLEPETTFASGVQTCNCAGYYYNGHCYQLASSCFSIPTSCITYYCTGQSPKCAILCTGGGYVDCITCSSFNGPVCSANSCNAGDCCSARNGTCLYCSSWSWDSPCGDVTNTCENGTGCNIDCPGDGDSRCDVCPHYEGADLCSVDWCLCEGRHCICNSDGGRCTLGGSHPCNESGADCHFTTTCTNSRYICQNDSAGDYCSSGISECCGNTCSGTCAIVGCRLTGCSQSAGRNCPSTGCQCMY